MNTQHLATAKGERFAAIKRISELLDDESPRYSPLVSLALGFAWAIIVTLLVTSVFVVD